jgi:hypothetical protein
MQYKNIKILIISVLMLGVISCQTERQNEETVEAEHHHHDTESTEIDPNTTKSIPREAHGQVGDAHVTIKYYSPGVRGRVIWGGLVTYDEVWVTGAHQATNITFSAPVRIDGKMIPAGTYALFSIPGREVWTLILNRNWEQHLTDDYDEADDLLRVTTRPEEIELEERLVYDIQKVEEGKGRIKIAWENKAVYLDFEA